jgi:hypothetical protein
VVVGSRTISSRIARFTASPIVSMFFSLLLLNKAMYCFRKARGKKEVEVGNTQPSLRHGFPAFRRYISPISKESFVKI